MHTLSQTAWWLEEARSAVIEAPAVVPWEGDGAFDVAIVGAGFTGLWTALAIRHQAPTARVALFEADEVGDGPSGRNGGFLHGYWTHLGILRARFGADAALSLCRLSDRIIPEIDAFLRERGEDAWLRVGGRLKAATNADQEVAIARSVATAAELGVPEECVPLDRDAIQARLGSERFRSGAFVRDGAIVQPARLALALRRAAVDAGVAVHERSRVTDVRPGLPCRLAVAGGTVTAEHVVVATNAWMARWAPVARRMTAFSSYVALTEPIPELLAELGWRGDESVTDGRMFVHYFRPTPDGRLAMGTASGPISRRGRVDERLLVDAATARRAEQGIRFLLPRLRDVRVERAWGGPIDVSADHLPFIGTLPGTHVHYAGGYSGHGVGPSWLAGRALAAIVTDRDDEFRRMPLVDRHVAPLPPEPLKSLGGSLVRRAILSCELAEQAGRPPRRAARAVARIPSLVGMELGTR